MKRTGVWLAIMLALLVGLPLAGVGLAGKPLELYLEFPPRTRYVEHEPFSWPVFIGLAIFIVGFISPFMIRICFSRPMSYAMSHQPDLPPLSGTPHRSPLTPHVFFPWWGWAGIGLTVIAWVLAWTRFPWFELLQPYTFTPVWVGYILVVQAWTFACTGRCLMLDEQRNFLMLFPLSSVFWWFFEYLNRFVQNWSYAGIGEFTPFEYFIHATISFSTVLPAVLGTKELLASFTRLNVRLKQWHAWGMTNPKPAGWGLLLISGAGLAWIGIWPNYLFPLVWIAPLLVITAIQMIAGDETIFAPITRGDWRPIWQAALAALLCGFFWELWNSKSLAHWEYAVPFVQRFHLFEMPLLGYAGYLPFGLECVAVAGLLGGRKVH